MSQSFGGSGLSRTPSNLQRKVEDVDDLSPCEYLQTRARPLETTMETGIPDFASTTLYTPPPPKRRRQDERKLSGSRIGYGQRDRSDSSPLTPGLTASSSVMSRQEGSIGSSVVGGIEMISLSSNVSNSSENYPREQARKYGSRSDHSDGTVLNGFGAGQSQPETLMYIGGAVNNDPRDVDHLASLSFNGELSTAPEMNRSASNESNASARSHQRRREVLDHQEKTVLRPKGQSAPQENAASGQSLVTAVRTNRSYRRAQHPVWCDICDPFHRDPERYQFRGEHELKRHRSTKHDQKRVVWRARDGTSEAAKDGVGLPMLPLSQCKRCNLEKKLYNTDYNLTSHLRRQHFDPTGKKGSKSKGHIAAGSNPTSRILKQYWMDAIEVEARNADEEDDAHNDENDSDAEIEEPVPDTGLDDNGHLPPRAVDAEGDEAMAPAFDNDLGPANSFHHVFQPEFAGSSPLILGHASPSQGQETIVHFGNGRNMSGYDESSYLESSSDATDHFTASEAPHLDYTSSRHEDFPFFVSEAETLFPMNDSFGGLDGSESPYHLFDPQQDPAAAFPPYQ